MDEEQILLELQKRNVDVNSLMSSSNNILQELKSRGLEETQDGNFLPTVEQQRKDQGAYGRIVDDMEIPETNSRSQAIHLAGMPEALSAFATEVIGQESNAAVASPEKTQPLKTPRHSQRQDKRLLMQNMTSELHLPRVYAMAIVKS